MPESLPVPLNYILYPSCSFLRGEHLLFMLLLFLLIYGLPSLMAYLRSSKNLIPIIWCNLLLGWTVIVWIVVLIWALNTGSYDYETEENRRRWLRRSKP